MSRQRYAKNAGAVFSLKYHLVWCPKYRPPVLAPPVDTRLKQLLAEIAGEHGMTLHAVEVMPDHVPIFVESAPTRCVAEIVNRFKGRRAVAKQRKHIANWWRDHAPFPQDRDAVRIVWKGLARGMLAKHVNDAAWAHSRR
jgi:REP element-mobilizing transposase RayT